MTASWCPFVPPRPGAPPSPKVSDLDRGDVPLPFQQQVLQLQVPVHDASAAAAQWVSAVGPWAHQLHARVQPGAAQAATTLRPRGGTGTRALECKHPARASSGGSQGVQILHARQQLAEDAAGLRLAERAVLLHLLQQLAAWRGWAARGQAASAPVAQTQPWGRRHSKRCRVPRRRGCMGRHQPTTPRPPPRPPHLAAGP